MVGEESGAPPDRSKPGTRRLILNPVSGHGDHGDRASRLAADHGFAVERTERPGHAAELAEAAAADGVDLLAVCGGDGTVHEVVRGLIAADALDRVTVCIVPAGTENIVAGDVGVPGLAAGFEVAETGETRRIDVGTAGGEPFVLSAIAGLPADASAAATRELKDRFGPLAFVIGGVAEGLAFDGLHLDVDVEAATGGVRWRGEALAVLIGNVRRFAKTGGQANAEDGLLELVIVERMPSSDLLAEAIEQRLLGRETPHVTDLRATGLDVVGLDRGSVTFSLDGEIREFEEVRIDVEPRALRLRVGEEYEPAPDGEGG